VGVFVLVVVAVIVSVWLLVAVDDVLAVFVSD